MQITSLIQFLRLSAISAAIFTFSGCVAPYPPPQGYNNGGGGYNAPPSYNQPSYNQPSHNQPSYSDPGYGPANDNGATVHCGVDHDHPPHRFHSKMHHEHYCPGGPHRH